MADLPFIYTIMPHDSMLKLPALPMRGLVARQASGCHSLFAARVLRHSFEDVIESGWGFSKRHRLEEALDRQVRFIASLSYVNAMAGSANPHRLTVELRFVYRPEEELVDVILVGKAFGPDENTAQEYARSFWLELSASLPFDYVLEPAIDEPGFMTCCRLDWIRAIRRPDQVAEIRRLEEIVFWNPMAYLLVPFAWHFRTLDQIGRALRVIDQPCMIAISLRPVVLSLAEKVLLGQLCEAMQELSERVPYLSRRARLAGEVYASCLESSERLFLMRVQLMSPAVLPRGLPLAVASALSHSAIDSAERGLNPGCAIVYPARQVPAQLAAAKSNLLLLEQTDWSPSPMPPLFHRLRYLVDARGAHCAFQLPIPPAKGLPDVQIGRELEERLSFAAIGEP